MRTLEERKELAVTFLEELMNKQDLEAVDRYCSPDFVDHTLPPGTPSREGLKASCKTFIDAFPDGRYKLEHVIGEGDKVVIHSTMFGTHKGELQGMPPTGKRVEEVESIDIIRFDHNDKVAEHWAQYDTTRLMEQLGVMPGGARAA